MQSKLTAAAAKDLKTAAKGKENVALANVSQRNKNKAAETSGVLNPVSFTPEDSND